MRAVRGVFISVFFLTVTCLGTSWGNRTTENRDRSFNSGWRFLHVDAPGAEAPGFDATSFRAAVRKTYEGRCLAILRPKGGSGKITFKAEADGLKPTTIVIKTRWKP